MKHTFLNFKKTRYWRSFDALRFIGLIIFCLAFTSSLTAQKMLTGSGSTACDGRIITIDGEDEKRVEYIACPDNPNSKVVKIQFVEFKTANLDEFTIYEGCGTEGLEKVRYIGAAASAAKVLGTNWFSADSCPSTSTNEDGCLTIVYEPFVDGNHGLGIEFKIDCETKTTEITCEDITLPSACDINDSGKIGAIHTIKGPTATCSYEPIVTNIIIQNPEGNPIGLDEKDSKILLKEEGDYHDIDGIDGLTVGDEIFLEMKAYTFSVAYTLPTGEESLCEYKVTVAEISPVCNNQVNISLGRGCSTLLTSDMIIEGEGCSSEYSVNIMEGDNIGKEIVTYADIGKKLKVEVVSESSQNRCWGIVLVEDKHPPVITCEDAYIYCGLPTDTINNPDLVPIGDDCSLYTLEFTSGPWEDYACGLPGDGDAPDTMRLERRIWTGIDQGGTRSNPCTQRIFRLRPKLEAKNIIWPDDIILACGEDQSILPEVTGLPSIVIGTDTVPIEKTCIFGIEYDDQKFTTDCEGSQKISRIWTIIDWCNNNRISTGAPVLQSNPQIIKVLDTIPPTLANVPTTLEYLTNHEDCSASVIFPAIDINDVCSNTGINYRVVGPNTTIYHTPGSLEPDTMRNVTFGEGTFYYIAEDGCGNQEVDSIVLDIKDATFPTAIATPINVSLIAGDDLTWVYANSFDGNSHDNCGVTTVLARKVGDTDFTDAIGFTCDDLNSEEPVMVEIQVVDESGNTNTAMSIVSVNDELGVCNCGIDLSLVASIDKEFYCQNENITLIASGGITSGVIQYEWSSVPEDADLPEGITTINEFTVSPEENTIYTVKITIEGNDECVDEAVLPINIHPILSVTVNGAEVDEEGITICPGNKETTIIASGGDGNYMWTFPSGATSMVDSITPQSAGDYIVQSGCIDPIKVKVNLDLPEILINNSDEGTFTICPGETLEAIANVEGSYIWTFEDEEFANPITPRTAGLYTVEFINTGTGCIASKEIEIGFNELPDILINGEVVNEDDPITICSGETLEASGGGEGAIYVWKLGDDEINNPITPRTAGDYILEVSNIEESGCMVSKEIEVILNERPDATITVVDEFEQPIDSETFICPDAKVTISAAAGFNYEWTSDPEDATLPEGSTTEHQITVTPGVNTAYKVKITGDTGCSITPADIIIKINTIKSPGGIVIVESPVNKEEHCLSVAITDNVENATYSYRWTVDNKEDEFTGTDTATPKFKPASGGSKTFNVTVTNNDTGCSITPFTNGVFRPAPMATLSGTISTEEGEMVERATINLTDYDMPAQVTGATGNYGFQEVPMNENYTVSPEKDMNPLNGVSTYDLVLISKHILGITPLDSPYKMIAADINQSGTITAFDMVQLRQLILNITPDFANNTSWRFVDAAYEFSDPTNPLREAFPETYAITDLTADMTWLDFIAIKIGDVNNSAVVNQFMTTESRSATQSLNFQAKQGLSEDGQYLIFDFTSNNFNAISGYQFALEFDPSVIAFDQIIPSQWVGKDNFGLSDIDRGQIATSWNEAEGMDIATDEVLFSLVFQLNGEVTSDELLEIANTQLQAEAYSTNGKLLNVQLIGEEIAPQVAAKSIQLFQNRPNPFTGKTTIGFALPEASEATLRIFDSAGRMIQVYDGYYEKGYNELIISSQDLTEYGALYYQLATPTQMATMKMIHAQ